MNVKNCKKCGRIYNYVVGVNLCPSCREGLETKFQEVKSYIQEHRGAGIQELSETCDVEVGQIQQWIREERLVFSEDSPISIGCETCGTMIKTGRFCQKCKNELTNNLNGAMRKPVADTQPQTNKEEKAAPRMRFLDR